MENLEINNQQTKPALPKTFLLRSIFAMLFMWPLGIPAILNSAKVLESYVVDDYEGANEASAKADKWSKIALITAIAWWVFYFIFVMIYAIVMIIAVSTGAL